MQPDANTAHADFIADITRGLLAGLAQRPGEPSARRDAYAASLAFCVMAFQPRDMPELTAANHCVRFHRPASTKVAPCSIAHSWLAVRRSGRKSSSR